VGYAARVLLDMNPDADLSAALRDAIEGEGDTLVDLHLWRLGPGHLGAILSVQTDSERGIEHYRETTRRVGSFSHLTIEITRRPPRVEPERRSPASAPSTERRGRGP